MGQTGAGKSTIINFLMKKKIIEVNHPEGGGTYYDVENSEESKFKIGKNVTSSETDNINVTSLKQKNSNVYLVDTPGFSDTRGLEIEIANMANLQNVINKCNSIRPVLVLNYN